MTPKGIAKKYALALFRTMKKKDQLNRTGEEFAALRAFLDSNKEVKNFLYNFPVKEGLKKEIVGKIGQEYSAEFVRFLRLLIEKNRFNLLELIEDYFEQFVNEEQGLMIAQVSTPMPLEKDQKEEMIKVLQEISGKNIRLEEKIEPEIKGGFIIRLGEKVFDASVTTQLETLYRNLTA